MRDYGKVYTSFWSSPTITALSEDGRLLAMYLITSPHSTIAGVFRLPDGYVCEDLNWTQERVSKGFAELFQKGYSNRCETTKWVWICKHFEWNKPENPNQRKSAAKMALSIPDECAWKLDFMRVCGPLLGISWNPPANHSATVKEPFLNQKQKQEQEQEDSSDLLSQSEPLPTEPLTEFSIPLVDSTEYQVPVKDFDQWVNAFPAVDVPQELRQMRAWVTANPTKRKTRRGVSAFIVRWLSKAQDMPSRNNHSANARPEAFV